MLRRGRSQQHALEPRIPGRVHCAERVCAQQGTCGGLHNLCKPIEWKACSRGVQSGERVALAACGTEGNLRPSPPPSMGAPSLRDV